MNEFYFMERKDAILTFTADRRARWEWNHSRSRCNNIGSVKEHRIYIYIYLAGLAGPVDCTLYAVLRTCIAPQLGAARLKKMRSPRSTRLFFRPSVPCGIPRSPRSRKVTAPWIGSRARIPTVEKLNSSSGLWTSFDSGIGFEQPFASYCFRRRTRKSCARFPIALFHAGKRACKFPV